MGLEIELDDESISAAVQILCDIGMITKEEIENPENHAEIKAMAVGFMIGHAVGIAKQKSSGYIR